MSPAYYYNQGGGAPNPAQTMQMPPRGIPGQMGLPQAHFLQQQQQAQQAPFRQPSMNDPNLHRKRAHSKVRLAINRKKQTRQDFLLFFFFSFFFFLK
jgi:hypothetical protein